MAKCLDDTGKYVRNILPIQYYSIMYNKYATGKMQAMQMNRLFALAAFCLQQLWYSNF